PRRPLHAPGAGTPPSTSGSRSPRARSRAPSATRNDRGPGTRAPTSPGLPPRRPRHGRSGGAGTDRARRSASRTAPGTPPRRAAPGSGSGGGGPPLPPWPRRLRLSSLDDLLQPSLLPVLIPGPARAHAVVGLEGEDRPVHVAAVACRDVGAVLEREDDRAPAV